MFRAVLAFLILFALPAAADPPQQRFPKWWQGQQAKELSLTTEQSNRIEEIFQNSLPRIRTAMDDWEAAQRELDKLVAGDRTTEMDVIRQLNKVQAFGTEVNRQRTLMTFRFYRELTPDQRLKVKAMFDRREQERRGRGRGDEPAHPPIKK
jgi:Spy/CpxP family protein refolding chaperone